MPQSKLDLFKHLQLSRPNCQPDALIHRTVSSTRHDAGQRARSRSRQPTGACCARRLHLLTKHRVFSGPGFLVAQEVGDAAHGGQVLLTHDAWLELRNDMDQV